MTRDVHWCVTVDYRQIANDNRANQIHGFTINYGKLILILFYFHSKYFSVSDWFKTELIIHHNQLLLTKYWTNDVKGTACCKLLNRWRQNDVKSAARCRLLNRWRRKLGDKVVRLFWLAEKQRAKWRNSFKNGEIFWINSNKAIDQFRYIKIQPNTMDLSTRLWGINPTNSPPRTNVWSCARNCAGIASFDSKTPVCGCDDGCVFLWVGSEIYIYSNEVHRRW